ncbi:MAG: DUF2029 domain-containing protein [Rhodovulum sp.]|nr:DUF2029 domain-containing protein [Rhodovulum sp.]
MRRLDGLWSIARSGDWLTRARVRLWATALLGFSTVALMVVAATSDGWTDWQGRPLGTDFSCFWTAGLLVLDGRPALAFDPATLHGLLRAIFGPDTAFYGWLYPPPFLLVAGLLALMPYPVALGLWLATTLALYLVALRALLRAASADGAAPATAPDPLWLLLALAFPAVFVTAGHGQNGFLTAALFAGALAVIDRRPLLAGVLFGLLVYKPQFGLLIPVALVAGGRWRAVAAVAVTVAGLALLTLAAFGTEPWRAFLEGSGAVRTEVLEAGSAGWHKLHGVFAWTRMWGGAVPLAYALHGAVALVVGGAVAWIWRAGLPLSLRAAALLIGAFVVAPHSHDYDLMLLAPALAMLIVDGLRRGYHEGEKTLFAVVFVVPLFTRAVAEHTAIPLGTVAALTLFAAVLRRCNKVGRRENIDDVKGVAVSSREHLQTPAAS